MKCDENVIYKVIMSADYRMIHDLCIIRVYTMMVPINACKCIEISLYKQLTRTCFCQLIGHLQGCKIQRLGTFRV
jgi:hypothetical protein